METIEETKIRDSNSWQQQFEESLKGAGPLRPFDCSNEFRVSDVDCSGDFLIGLFKKTLLFLPGAILLFMTANFLFLTFFSHYWDLFQVFLSLPWVALYGFMVMYGLGDIRNPKHTLLPISIVLLSFFFCLIPLLVTNTGFISHFYSRSFYLMPLVLMVPVIVKQWVETEQE